MAPEDIPANVGPFDDSNSPEGNEEKVNEPVSTCYLCPESDVKTCIKCQRSFCFNHTSKVSPQFCVNCFAEVTLYLEKYFKTEDEYDPKTNTVRTRKSSCKLFRLDGPDWVWYSVSIQQLTDEELETQFQFHKFMVSLIEHVTTVRKVQAANALAKVKMPKQMKVTSTTEIRKKREAKPVNLQDLLRKQGLSEDVINKMLQVASSKE